MIRFTRRDILLRFAGIRLLLSQSALTAGLVLLLSSAAPAAVGLVGSMDQPPAKNLHAVPPHAANAHRKKSHRETARDQSAAAHKQPVVEGPFQIIVATARQQ